MKEKGSWKGKKKQEGSTHPAPDVFVTGAGSAPQTHLEPGTCLLNRYELHECIGQGGMGEVWKAYDRQQERFCALKHILPSLLELEEARMRFQREIDSLSHIQSPYVIALYDFHLHDHFFTMELLTGLDLRQTLVQKRRFTLHETLSILMHLTLALQAVHQQNVLHRDLKPSNVFFTSDGQVKLLDFGIARQDGLAHTALTKAGHLGTPYYLAPELLQPPYQPSPKSDVYSLGILLYEMFSGEVPMVGSPPLGEVATALLQQERLAPQECPHECHESFLALVATELQQLYMSTIRHSLEKRATLASTSDALQSLLVSYQTLLAEGAQVRAHWIQSHFHTRTDEEFQSDLQAAYNHFPTLHQTFAELEDQRKHALATQLASPHDWLQCTITPGHTALRPASNQSLPVLLQLHAKEAAPLTRPPLTLLFCIDNSTSMHGEPMQLVLDSVRLVIDQLGPNDRIALISFSTSALCWVPTQHCNQQTRLQAYNALQSIQANGWTAMYDGLKTCFDHLPEPRPEELTRVLLLSDGEPNRGLSTPDQLAAFVKGYRQRTSVSVFGFSPNHNETVLQSIAKAGGGNYTYIQDAQSIETGFALEFGGLLSTVARQTKLLIQPHEGCIIRGLRGDNETQFSHQGLQVQLGDLIAERELNLLVDLEVDASNTSELPNTWATFSISYLPPQATSPTQQILPLSLPASPNAPSEYLPTVARQLLLHEAGETWQNARRIADQNQYPQAAQELRNVLPQLKAHPDWHDETSNIRDWYEQFVDEIELYESRPSQRDYNEYRKYAMAEMQVPGSIVASQRASASVGTALQQEMVRSLRKDGEHAKAQLIVQKRGNPNVQSFPLVHELTIGRVGGNDVHVPSSSFSKRHAKLVTKQGKFVLVDFKSTNGVYFQGQRVQSNQELHFHDTFYIGDYIFSLQPTDNTDPSTS